MNKINELKAEIEKLEGSERFTVNIDEKLGFLHLNCADHQAIEFKNGKYSFATVGGSRYFYTETFTSVKECAEFCVKIGIKTTEEINEEYRKIAGFLNA